MQAVDNNSAVQQITSKINASKVYNEVSKSSKQLKKSLGNSATESVNFTQSQLEKIKDLQKRFQRQPPNSLDNLLGFLGQTKGNGSDTLRYLKKKILEAVVKIEPKMKQILEEESLKALGCSQEQTYKGTSSQSLLINPLPLRPQQEGIYIPVESVDFFSNLKNSPETKVGKVYYEKENPSGNVIFKPFGGVLNFPMNKQLYQIMDSQNAGRSLSQVLGKTYTGKSGKPLFDIQYTTINSFGVSGNYFRVLLLNRESDTGSPIPVPNLVGEMLSDYYGTIKLVDPVSIGAQIVNLISNAVSIQANLGSGEIEKQSKFFLIAQRILGLCFDNRSEIDVSGVAKIAELDGIDDSFFELNEIDLRSIEINLNNIQRGIVQFEDCNNVDIPVNSEVLIDELINFRESNPETIDEQVKTLEKITNTLTQNPELQLFVPKDLQLEVAVDKSVIKKIPLAIAAAVLTPKILLPLYTLQSVIQSGATYTYNQAVTSANTFAQSGQILGQNGSNIVTSAEDFLKKWKTFAIQVISKINAEFLQVLFDELKKDIINLIALIIRDIQTTQANKRLVMVLRLIGLLIAVGQLIADYRKCKSLLDNILSLLNLINGFGTGQNTIPLPLMLMSKFLPGTSPERAFINTIQELQSIGIPTGTLPDGSPNLMLLYNLATHKGQDKENAENGKIEAYGIVPPVVGGVVTIYGKAI